MHRRGVLIDVYVENEYRTSRQCAHHLVQGIRANQSSPPCDKEHFPHVRAKGIYKVRHCKRCADEGNHYLVQRDVSGAFCIGYAHLWRRANPGKVLEPLAKKKKSQTVA